MTLSNLRIGTRLKGGFAIVLGFSALLALVAWHQFQKVDEIVTEINDSWTVSIVDLNGMMDAVSDVRRSELRYVLLSTNTERDVEDQRIAELWKTKETFTKRYEATGISSPEEQKLYDAFNVSLKAYQETWPRLRKFARAGDESHALAKTLLLGPSQTAYDAARALWAKDLEFNVTGAAKMKAKSVAAFTDSTRFLLATLAAILAFGSVFALWLGRSITAPLEQAMRWAKTIASGNLSTPVMHSGKDETGQLLAALGEMQVTLKGMIVGMRSSADEVSTASTQIAAGNSDLSVRTEEQAANLQETAASVEQLSATVAASESSARQAQALAASAMEIAAAGGVAVGRVSGTMNQISGSSKKIADIIGVIDSIAFQTNILALNAAVEAARAGEQGRGFAVVASEVRTLAQRSAQAAKEIKTLIQESVERVGEGDSLVAEAGSTMTRIVDAVKRVTQLITEISTAAAEQTVGIHQVNDAVTRLDQATQQNAALVEESAAASESLKSQATKLAASVAQFRV